jgi:hypothetical protein
VNIPTQVNRQHLYFAGGILLLLALFFAVNRATSWYKDGAFDEAVQKYEEKLKIEAQTSTEAKARAALWEQRAKQAEALVAINEAAVAAAGKKAEAIRERIQNEDAEFTEAMQRVDTDFSPCTRIINICESAKRLGYLPKTHPCTCTDQ